MDGRRCLVRQGRRNAKQDAERRQRTVWLRGGEEWRGEAMAEVGDGMPRQRTGLQWRWIA